MKRAGLTRRGAAAWGGVWLGSLLAAGVAHAEPVGLSTEWTGQKAGRVRLLAAQVPGISGKAARIHAAVHVRLSDGWKTYWRQPGESGVPPSFDWSGSANLAEARVLYPVPARLPEAGMISLGYKGEVVFPVEIVPREPGQPIALKLAFEYGVCKDICIPAEARLSLTVPAIGGPADDGTIARGLARVPFPAVAGGPAIAAVRSMATAATPHLVIDTIFPKGSDGADLLAEVPGGELLPLPVVTDRKGRDAVRFEVRFASAAEAQRFAGKPLRLTLISAGGQAEADAQLP